MPFVVIATSSNATAQQSREQEAYDTAVDAYIYLYSLVTMDITRLQMTNVPPDKAKGIQGPMNHFHHFREFPDAKFKTVVRVNFDTLYSSLWVDVTREPIIVSVPDSGGLYYLLPTLDMHSKPWTGEPPTHIPVHVEMETHGWGVQTVATGSLKRHGGSLTLEPCSAFQGVPEAVEAIKDQLSGRLTKPDGFL